MPSLPIRFLSFATCLTLFLLDKDLNAISLQYRISTIDKDIPILHLLDILIYGVTFDLIKYAIMLIYAIIPNTSRVLYSVRIVSTGTYSILRQAAKHNDITNIHGSAFITNPTLYIYPP